MRRGSVIPERDRGLELLLRFQGHPRVARHAPVGVGDQPHADEGLGDDRDPGRTQCAIPRDRHQVERHIEGDAEGHDEHRSLLPHRRRREQHRHRRDVESRHAQVQHPQHLGRIIIGGGVDDPDDRKRQQGHEPPRRHARGRPCRRTSCASGGAGRPTAAGTRAPRTPGAGSTSGAGPRIGTPRAASPPPGTGRPARTAADSPASPYRRRSAPDRRSKERITRRTPRRHVASGATRFGAGWARS